MAKIAKITFVYLARKFKYYLKNFYVVNKNSIFWRHWNEIRNPFFFFQPHLFQFSVWAALWPMWPLTRSYGWWLPHTASSPLLVKISLWFQPWLQPWNGFPTVKAPPWAWWWVALEAGHWSSTRSRQPSSISKITMYSIRCTHWIWCSF